MCFLISHECKDCKKALFFQSCTEESCVKCRVLYLGDVRQDYCIVTHLLEFAWNAQRSLNERTVYFTTQNNITVWFICIEFCNHMTNASLTQVTDCCKGRMVVEVDSQHSGRFDIRHIDSTSASKRNQVSPPLCLPGANTLAF